VSESAIIVCEISVTATEAPVRASAARRWLLDEGIVVPNPARDELWQPSEFNAGPRAVRVAPGFAHDHMRTLANNGVDVICERQVHHPVENYEPPCCPACDAGIAEGAERLGDWFERGEPLAACARCRKEHPLGDWIGKFSAYVAEVAVRFNNWPPIDPPVLEHLGRLLGPRWRVVFEHT
jgi:hypothetical protein